MRIDMSRMAAAAIEAALEEDGKPRRRRRSGLRAVATGAALAVAARVAVSKAPGHVHMPHLSSVPDRVRDRLADRGWLAQDDAEDDFDDEELDDEELDDEELDDEPDAEGDEDLEDEDLEQEPEAEADEEEPDDDDFDDEPDAEGDEEPEADADEEEPEADADEEEPEAEADEEEPEAEADEDEPDDDEAGGRRRAPGVAVDGSGGRTRGGTPDIIGMLGARRTPPVMSRAKARTSRPVDPAARPPQPPERESGKSTSSSKRRKATTKTGSR